MRSRGGGDERAGALLGVDDPPDLHLAVRLRDRVQVHRQIDGELPHRRQLRAGREAPVGDRQQHLVDDLPVERDAGRGVEPEDRSCHIRLVH